jgi:transcriptional regulator with XRE-family HTH domain
MGIAMQLLLCIENVEMSGILRQKLSVLIWLVFGEAGEHAYLGSRLLDVNACYMDLKIGEIIKQRVEVLGMSKAELARRLHMSSANVHKIFKRSSVDVALLRELCNILDYDFFEHFTPNVSRKQKRTPIPYDVGDIEVLFIRYVVDLQSRVQILEQRWENFRSSGRVEEPYEAGYLLSSRTRRLG